jgi:hypothetical protein
MKKCKLCGELKVREQGGIAVSKWCTPCKKTKDQEKKLKKHSYYLLVLVTGSSVFSFQKVYLNEA